MPNAWRPWWKKPCAGLNFAALDRLAVTTGPGTFTGQRVGLAFMRGLRLALQESADRRHHLGSDGRRARWTRPGNRSAAVIHDARRDEAYLLLQEGDDVVQQPVVLPFAERWNASAPSGLARWRAPARPPQ